MAYKFKDELTAHNQQVCADWYGYARAAMAAGDTEKALYWQNGAAAHMVKVQHRMGTLEATMQSCVLQQRKAAFLEAQYHAKFLGIKLEHKGNFEQVWL